MTELPTKTEDKHKRILQAAIKVFAKNGFYNSKVSEIAQEAGVADGTIYLYFKNKDDILISLFEEEMEKIIQNMKQEIGKEEDLLKKLKMFAVVQLNSKKENPDLAAIMEVELRQSSKFMKEYVNMKFIEYLKIVSSIIKEGQKKGIIKKEVDPTIVSRAFWGALDEVARFWVLSPRKKVSLSTSAELISDIFIKGMVEAVNRKS
ncbi:MAG: TetR/AcrR family transcriptional regulator [Deltaproteobacteria bacterium]|jgi:TetR/AcrR family fatty acid metabolism transcriptional regulator|nr:MAG: TetR/AcrR family transcriptional regulator [Deltaproteobacteria bacterium]